MDSHELTRDQCQAIQIGIQEQRQYFRRLVARMEANDFPAADRLLAEATEILDLLDGFWMHLHYLECPGQMGGRRR
jgi:hypothetical protein